MKYVSKKIKTSSLVVMILVIFIAASPIQAQWSVGGLLNISNTSFLVDPEPNSADYSSRFGFGMGAVIDRPLTGPISLHAEPMFMQKGGKVDISNENTTLKISYFEFPIMIKYNFQTLERIVPYAMAGPSLGFLLNAKAEIEDGDENDIKDQFENVDFSLGFGGGISIPRENLGLFAEARYLLGLANINAEDDVITVKNRGLQILFGATVPISKLIK